MYFRFKSNNRIYVTTGEPGDDSALCIARPDVKRRGHPKYSRVIRSVPDTAERVIDPPKTVKALLRQFARATAAA